MRERLGDVLGELDRDTAIVIGGECSVSAAPIARLAGDDLAVVWFDAHPDLNTPATSPSRAFSGMVLAALVEDGTVAASRVVIAGARSWDPGEESFATDHEIRSIGPGELGDPADLVDAVRATGASRVYLHVDLDVLDPAEFDGLLDPEPFGVAGGELVAAIRALRAEFALAGATIAGFAPASQAAAVEDAPTILRIIAALTR